MFADSDRPLVSSGNFILVGVFETLMFSLIPRWLKLKSPMPSVLTASSFCSVGSALLDFSDKVSTTGLSTSLGSDCPRLFDLFPGASVEVVILLLRVLAALVAAENTDEKKPVCWLVLGLGCSGVGVRGADCIFDNLLGPRFADPDLTRR